MVLCEGALNCGVFYEEERLDINGIKQIIKSSTSNK